MAITTSKNQAFSFSTSETNSYYHIDSHKHIYYDAYDVDFIRTLAANSVYDIYTMNPANCQFDLDCDPSRALEEVPI